MSSNSKMTAARRLPTAANLLRHFGAMWLVQRGWYALQVQSGQLRKRMPPERWQAWPLSRCIHLPSGQVSVQSYWDYRRKAGVRFFFDPAQREAFQAHLTTWDNGDETAVEAAEMIEGGTFTYFHWHRFLLGFPPDWHCDPFTGSRLPSGIHWSQIPDFCGSDIKVVWEPSRFGFAFTLVRAYWRTGEDRFAECFWRLLESWCEENPPNQGANWKCGQEVSLRVLACCFAFYGFFSSPATTAERAALMARLAAVSGHRIERNLNYAVNQQNNHGISEAAGLWTLGVLFPECIGSERWKTKGRRILEALGRQLIYEDGAFSQHSANYHRLMLHLYLWVLRLADVSGCPFSAELKHRVGKAANFLYQIMNHSDGRVPNYGQNDGALILPVNECEYADFRPVVQAHYYLATGSRCFDNGPWDEDLLWFFGPAALEAEIAPPVVTDFSAPWGGCYTLRAKESFALLRCGPHRHRPGQADQLHVDLFWKGLNLALDAGTYSYNAEPPWDNPFAHSRFHNTVTVDGRDQMDRAGRFLWFPWTAGSVTSDSDFEDPRLRYRQAEHDGYLRLASPVRHQRGILTLGESRWIVVDRMLAEESHDYRLHWLLAAFEHRWDAAGRVLELQTPQGAFFVSPGVFGGKAAVSVSVAEPESPRGWYAPYYLDRRPAISLALNTRGSAVAFWTLFSPFPISLRHSETTLHIQSGTMQAEVQLNPPWEPKIIAAAALRHQVDTPIEALCTSF